MTGTRSHGYLHSVPFDVILLIGSPLLCLVLGFFASRIPPGADEVFFLDQPTTMTSLALKSVIHSHLFIVFFRSHGNEKVRRRHPVRFWVVPALLFLTTFVSFEALAVAIIVSTYWDNIHSSLQTFGIGRIYDMKAGGDVDKGRQQDIWLNYLMYFAPFLAGPIWNITLPTFAKLGYGPEHALIRGLTWMQPWFQAALWVIAPAYLAYYAWHTWRRLRAGEVLSWQKYALFASTGVTAVWAWGFNPFGQALLIVNVFHAVQYFAIVWWSERKNLGTLLGVSATRLAPLLSALLLVFVGAFYGFWIASASDVWATTVWAKRFVLALTNTVAILHFWYDGFIWSVRKKDV
jgi:hypothetical protein